MQARAPATGPSMGPTRRDKQTPRSRFRDTRRPILNTNTALGHATAASGSEESLRPGIHVEADDLAGRVMGSEIGRTAWTHGRHFLPTPTSAD